jgi:rhodanese-related sulfurtransferase
MVNGRLTALITAALTVRTLSGYDRTGMAPTIDEYLAVARSKFQRVQPEDLASALAHGALLVDIRPERNRVEDGQLPGAVVIDRGVLEWRLAPSSEARTIDVEPGRQVIVVCNEGYQSSLAAATLIDLGVEGATDLVGGFRAWSERIS